MPTVKKTTTKKTTTKKEVENNVPEVEVAPEAVTTTDTEEPKEGGLLDELTIDKEVADVSNAPKEKNVRVRLKKDFEFNFGKERYELKAGQCYNVPVDVKLHLNKFDALSPL